jgi:hypothetical protein
MTPAAGPPDQRGTAAFGALWWSLPSTGPTGSTVASPEALQAQHFASTSGKYVTSTSAFRHKQGFSEAVLLGPLRSKSTGARCLLLRICHTQTKALLQHSSCQLSQPKHTQKGLGSDSKIDEGTSQAARVPVFVRDMQCWYAWPSCWAVASAPCTPLTLLPGGLPGVHSRGCSEPPAGSTPPTHAQPRDSGRPAGVQGMCRHVQAAAAAAAAAAAMTQWCWQPAGASEGSRATSRQQTHRTSFEFHWFYRSQREPQDP